ncbi:probable extracellular repeat, HAF family [Edwardsiella tarda]|nr:probable extracellular repeat, HAF family [Edwardsiella tarda]
MSILILFPFIQSRAASIDNKRWLSKINDLDSLEPDISNVTALSANGQVVGGSSISDQAFIWREGYPNQMIRLGTLRADNQGISSVVSLSSDGKVAVGVSYTEMTYHPSSIYQGESQAYIWHEGDTKITGLGTLSSSGRGWSRPTALTPDGKVVAGQADTDSGQTQAFIWHEGDTKMNGLGTLKTDNSGVSSATALSADGKVVAGQADTDSGQTQAFIWHEGDTKMNGLGTLKTDNSGGSSVAALSADGKVVVGRADTNSGDSQAFIWHEGDTKMNGLGTLKMDNSGVSSATALSADGKVVAGQADTNSGDSQAFIWHEGDTKMNGLGTLKTDNSGVSSATALSADGKVVAGQADTDSGQRQAFIWHEGDTKMNGLGTLKMDNSGNSSATALSADGRVVIGRSETDNGKWHAVIWKVKYPEPPTVRPEIVIVDRDNSHLAMMDTANRGFKVLDLYQSALSSLANARCQMGDSNYCIGAFSQLNSVQDNSHIATGLFGSFKLPENNWTLGAAINFVNQTRLIDNYDTRGSSKPGLGVFTRYQDNSDGSGLNIDISAAYIQQDITITRDKLSHTESGKGESAVKGYQVGMSAVYAINVNEYTQLLPLAAITHHRVTRDGYRETRNAEFPATYGEMDNERTELQLGVNARHQVNPAIQLDGGMGAKIKLNEKRDAFTGHINYIGAYAYDKGETALARPYVQAGVNFAPTKNSTLRVSVGFEKADYTNDTATVGLSYSYNW